MKQSQGAPSGFDAGQGRSIAAVLIALAIVCVLEIVWLAPWYVAVPLSMIGYLVIRYGRFFVSHFKFG